jgi:hypothetical protein
MHQIAIRCHPNTPVASDEVDAWLRTEVARLRELAPRAALRLLRLSQALPSGDADAGWLIELDPAGETQPLNDDELSQILRDLRLLGLQPTLYRAGLMVGSDFALNGGQH